MSLRNTGPSDWNSCLFCIGKRNVFHYILLANEYLWRFSSRIYVPMGVKGTKYYLFSLSLPFSPELLCLNCSQWPTWIMGQAHMVTAWRKVLPQIIFIISNTELQQTFKNNTQFRFTFARIDVYVPEGKLRRKTWKHVRYSRPHRTQCRRARLSESHVTMHCRRRWACSEAQQLMQMHFSHLRYKPVLLRKGRL